MSFMDKFQRGADQVKFKANQLSRINKLQNEILSIRGQIQSIRKQIADVAMDVYAQKGELPEDIENLCKNIQKHQASISDLEEDIASVQAETFIPKEVSVVKEEPAIKEEPEEKQPVCPYCNEVVPKEAEFCIHCGKSINE